MSKRRALGAIRLSVLTDETTSPHRQKEIIGKAAEIRGSEVIEIAEDLDVSAGISPFAREGLGPWLRERHHEFDELIFWKLDRVVRSVGDMADLIKWAKEHKKNLVSATEPFDLSTPLGEAVAYLIAVFAQMERNAIIERVTAAMKYLRDVGRWTGGKPPYGLMPAENPDGRGWVLVHDPVAVGILREMVRRIAEDGDPIQTVVDDLNRRQVPTPSMRWAEITGKPAGRGTDGWTWTAARKILRSETLTGATMYSGRVLTGPDGLALPRAEPIVSQTDWAKLQAALDAREGAPRRTRSTGLLLDVAYSACGAKLHRGVKSTLPGRQYYICARKRLRYTSYAGDHVRCDCRMIREATLEDEVEQGFLYHVGALEIIERVFAPGEDHSEELATVRRALARVRQEYDSGLYGYPGGEQDYSERTQRLAERLRALSSLPSRRAGYELHPTGETYAEAWARLDTSGRHELLVRSGVRIVAEMTALGLEVRFEWPEDLAQRMSGAGSGA